MVNLVVRLRHVRSRARGWIVIGRHIGRLLVVSVTIVRPTGFSSFSSRPFFLSLLLLLLSGRGPPHDWWPATPPHSNGFHFVQLFFSGIFDNLVTSGLRAVGRILQEHLFSETDLNREYYGLFDLFSTKYK